MYHPAFRPASLARFQRGLHSALFIPKTSLHQGASCSSHRHEVSSDRQHIDSRKHVVGCVPVPCWDANCQSLHNPMCTTSSSSSPSSEPSSSPSQSPNFTRKGLRTNEFSCWKKTNQTFYQHQNHLPGAQFSSYPSSSLLSRQPATSFLQPLGVPSTRQWVCHSSTEPTTAYESLLNSQPVHFAESIFQYVHSVTGLPWWATVVATTFTLRFSLTLPLAIYSQNIRVRVENLQPEVIGLAKRSFMERFAARAKQEKWSEKRAQRAFVGLVSFHPLSVF